MQRRATKLYGEQLAEAVQYWSRRYGDEVSPESVVELMSAIAEYLQWLRELAGREGNTEGGDNAASSATRASESQ